jgi:hypothetical protein
LADKVAGNIAGIWLLVAEHMRLGTWDLLRGWTHSGKDQVAPRLALQIVNEAAVCTSGIRSQRTLNGRGGFELACGLPFVASDAAIHDLLDSRPIDETIELQATLGRLRNSMQHFARQMLVIDPHRVQSHSRRRMRERSAHGSRPVKQAQTFWLLDAETKQPVCFTTSTAAVSVVEATPQLLELGAQILAPLDSRPLILADCEHFASSILRSIKDDGKFDLLVPMPCQPAHVKRWKSIANEKFTRRWAGLATAKSNFQFKYGVQGEYTEIVQRLGENPTDYKYKGFMTTGDVDEVSAITESYPNRWHIEEFFNFDQALGWQRAGTQNLNIRYGQMTLALIAQSAIHELRKRLGEPIAVWNANHLAQDLFFRLEGDVRVTDDTIIVTYYNAPNPGLLRKYYEGLPQRLIDEGVDPRVLARRIGGALGGLGRSF